MMATLNTEPFMILEWVSDKVLDEERRSMLEQIFAIAVTAHGGCDPVIEYIDRATDFSIAESGYQPRPGCGLYRVYGKASRVGVYP